MIDTMFAGYINLRYGNYVRYLIPYDLNKARIILLVNG